MPRGGARRKPGLQFRGIWKKPWNKIGKEEKGEM